MFINEYGDKNNPLVLLLAPMMVSGEDLYQLMHPFFILVTLNDCRRQEFSVTAYTAADN